MEKKYCFLLFGRLLIVSVSLSLLCGCSPPVSTPETERDFIWFLKRMQSVDHLPELEHSHIAMASTWDRLGGNNDGVDYKDFRPATDHQPARNVLLDTTGPGCIHRIFTGVVTPKQNSTRIQIFLDHQDKPTFDMPVTAFFDDENGPIPYPLVFHKSYPGTLLPIPFAGHCLVQLVNDLYGTPDFEDSMWGNYWQITYALYAPDVKVKTLTFPFTENEKAVLETTCKTWLYAEDNPPAEPTKWAIEKSGSLKANEQLRIPIRGSGLVRQMRISVDPATPETLNELQLKICWDGEKTPAIDVPVGRFFGNTHGGYGRTLQSGAAVTGKRAQNGEITYHTRFNSLLLGVTDSESYSCFPMPFAKGAEMILVNTGTNPVNNLRIRLDIEKMKHIPENWGRFQTTFNSIGAATETAPRVGLQNIKVHEVINQTGQGKYVGLMLSIDWPRNDWWGEGDFIIWTDEPFDKWPPDYHGTGSEEYFNSGWCRFDRKAVSGFACLRPGYPTIYTFHLNDAFQFRHNIRVVEEYVGWVDSQKYMEETHPRWSSVAYWYKQVNMKEE